MGATIICKTHDEVVPCWSCSKQRITYLEQKLTDLRTAVKASPGPKRIHSRSGFVAEMPGKYGMK